ncbi:MAG: four helix bundle protein [Gemmatimonadales bacterium]
MQNPDNLRVYAEARDLAAAIYQLTATFPPSERYGLVAQMRRAATSVGSNVAEGCGRQGNRALLAFLHQALGSLDELEFQLEHSVRVAHCSSDAAAHPLDRARRTRQMMIRLIAALRRRPDRTDEPEA